MAERLSKVYKKFLYGGESAPLSVPTTLYSSVRSKPAALKVPDTSTLINSMNAELDTWVGKSARENLLVTPLADDVEVPHIEATPIVPSIKPPDFLGTESPSGFDINTFKQEIANVESNGGNYSALNPKSSATGKYQFLFNTWRNQIAQVTGVKSRAAFLKNPEAQEKFMEHYTKTTVLPGVEKLRGLAQKRGLNDSAVAKLIHFQGASGAAKQLRTGEFAKRTSTNLSVAEYLKRSKL